MTADVIPVTELERVGYVRASVPCLNFADCFGVAEFVWRADQWPPPSKFRKRRCPSCGAQARAAKRRQKIDERRERDQQMKELGRLSAKREHTRRQKHRRKRLVSVPANLRSKIKERQDNDGR